MVRKASNEKKARFLKQSIHFVCSFGTQVRFDDFLQSFSSSEVEVERLVASGDFRVGIQDFHARHSAGMGRTMKVM